jgi:MinD-like ATPase involved in chromosome partitioning or flagellar assembly
MGDNRTKVSKITDYTNAVIANAAAVSDAIFVGGLELIGFYMPAGWTAADIAFQISNERINPTNFYDLFDRLNYQYKIPVTAGKYVVLDPYAFLGFEHIKVVSCATGAVIAGTTAATVNQGAARAVTLAFRKVFDNE